jgi:N-methylhydantoinase B
MNDDALTAEILHSALVAAAEEASIVVVRAAHSAFVVEGSDASAAILDNCGRLVAQSMATTLLHSASLRCSLPAVLEVFPLDTMRDGDVFCMNDVYRGGIHANDILVFKPVFAEGAPAWFSATLIHILDLGGSAAAGVSSLATDVFQEGLQLPPVRIGTAQGLDQQLLSIIAANSRLREATLGDLSALIAGANVAARRVQLLVDEYGPSGLVDGVAAHLRRTERLMRLALAAFPDGTYRAHYVVDDDGIHPDRSYTIAVAVTINGERATIDFTGTDDQVAASINAGFSQTMSGALFGLRCFLDPTIPMNEGCFSPVEFVIPSGSLLNCTPPFPGGGRFLAVFAAVEAVFQALSQANPARAIAASGILQPFALDGRTDSGRTWIHTAYELGGMGARFGMDGLDAVGVHHGGGRNAIGVQGGRPGRAGGYFRLTAAGELIRLPSKSSGVAFAAGDRFILETSGGGGLGMPALRHRDAIEQDIADGRVSMAGAIADYATCN